MKKIVILLTLNTFLITAFNLHAQDNEGGKPYSFDLGLSDDLTPYVITPAFDFAPLIALSEERVKQGTFELTDKLFESDYDLTNSGAWTESANGGRVWKLKITSPGAKRIRLYYKNFHLPEGAKLFVYNENRTEEIGAFTSKNNDEADSNEGIFSTDHLTGDVQIVEYYEPQNVRGQGHFSIFRVAHQFKSVASAESCQVDVMCPDGTNWQNQKEGVVRIYVVIGTTPSNTTAGYCSGSLVNNTALDCKKYILTAMHCSLDESVSPGVETIYYNQWVFSFDYQKTGCAAGTALANKTKTGCQKRAGANDDGGATGSDFLFLEMTAPAFPTGVTPYYNGWTHAAAATAGGTGIHHPSGDCKKISTFITTPTSTSWGGNVSDTHWQFAWEAGHGSTEPGSSGSPVFNSSGLIFGTLTGGGSCCVVDGCGWQTGDSPNGPTYKDAYGKMAYHWTSDGTTAPLQLKPWLDPISSNVTVLTGSFNPCATGISEAGSFNSIVVYPNPANGSFNVSIESGKANDIDISVFDIVGQMVSYKKIENPFGGTFNFNLADRASGIYFVYVKMKNETAVRKIILTNEE